MDDWEYCQIKVQISDDGRGFTRNAGPGNRLMWLRFIAQSDQAFIQRSERIPMPMIANQPLAPHKGNSSHQNVLEDLVRSLQHDGWELIKQKEGEWWQRRFRREATSSKKPNSILNKLEKRKIISALLIIALLVTGALISRSRTRFLGMSQIAKTEFQQAPASQQLAVGRMIAIDADTGRLDPVHDLLPSERTAEVFSDVDTIIKIDCESDSNWKGATTDCLITVLDWHKKSILGTHLIEGEFTLHPTEDQGDGIKAPKHTTAVIDYLTNLPTQQSQ